jgi:hypothetical protein
MPTWDVSLRTLDAEGNSTMSAAGYVADALPAIGDVIDVGGASAVVKDFRESDAGTVIVAERVVAELVADVTFVLGAREVAVAREETEWLRGEFKQPLDNPRTGGRELSDKVGRALRTGEPVIVTEPLRKNVLLPVLDAREPEGYVNTPGLIALHEAARHPITGE